MTNQEAFDKVVRHLRKQGKPARNGITCQYRTTDGDKCAIGALISDEEYNAKFENKGVGAITRDYYIPSLQGLDRTFLISLQGIHDIHSNSPYWLEEMESEAYQVAIVYNLTMPQV